MAKRDPNAERLPSIVDGRYVRTSPSQIETHLLCPLKWHFDKVEHLPRKPPSKGQKIGEQGHKQIEHLFETGEDVRGPIALAGRQLIDPYLARAPFVGGDIEVENGIGPEPRYPGLFTPGGVEFVGYIDVTVPPGPAEPEIIDHKFRSDLDRYGANEEDLVTDTQGVVYGKHALIRWPTAPAVRFSHHQHQHTGRRYANRVSVLLTREHVEREFARILAHVDGPMREHAAITDPSRVPFNSKACNAFGGCDFKATCPHAPHNLWLAGLTDDAASAVPIEREANNMGLLSKIDTSAAPAPSNPAAATAPAGSMPAKNGTSGKRYNLPGGKVGEFQAVAGARVFFTDSAGAPITCNADDLIVPVAEAPAAPALPPGAIAAKDAKQGQFYTVRGVLALFLAQTSGQASFVPAAGGSPMLLPLDEAVFPSAPPVSTPAASAPAAAQATAPVLSPDAPASTPGAVATKQDAPDEEDDDEAEGDETGAVSATAVQGEAAKAKRGRKPKAAEVAASAPVGGDALILIVDGVALSANGGASRDLTAYVHDLATKAANAAGVPDVRMASKDSPLAFGGWKGALAAAARQNPPKGICHVARGELADAVIEGLAPIASMVVRPSR